MSRSLKYRTLELLQKSPLSDKDISRQIGVSQPWVRMFREGDIKAPNVDTVQRLYEFLHGAPLFGEQARG